jgi:hypothetical protein
VREGSASDAVAARCGNSDKKITEESSDGDVTDDEHEGIAFHAEK